MSQKCELLTLPPQLTAFLHTAHTPANSQLLAASLPLPPAASSQQIPVHSVQTAVDVYAEHHAFPLQEASFCPHACSIHNSEEDEILMCLFEANILPRLVGTISDRLHFWWLMWPGICLQGQIPHSCKATRDSCETLSTKYVSPGGKLRG